MTDAQYQKLIAQDIYLDRDEPSNVKFQAGKFLHQEQKDVRHLNYGIYGALIGGGITSVSLLLKKKHKKSNNLDSYDNIRQLAMGLKQPKLF